MKRVYPVPGRTGGILIRKVICTLKEAGLTLPLTSDIHLAASAGPDSTALATLLIRYGRKIAKPTQIKLLHINHNWQGGVSSEFTKEVRRLGKLLNVRVEVSKLAKLPVKGESLEAVGHRERRKVFGQIEGWVFTAHHGDDLAETVLWRILTGGWLARPKGIRVRDGNILRPFIGIRKKQLLDFLEEEGVSYLEDPMNADSRFLRNRMRQRILPELEATFPRAVENLMRLAAKPDENATKSGYQILECFQKTQKIKPRIRRAWVQALENQKRTTLSEDWEMTSSKNQIIFSRRIR